MPADAWGQQIASTERGSDVTLRFTTVEMRQLHGLRNVDAGPMSVMAMFRQLREEPVNRVTRLHLDLRISNEED